MQRLACAFCGFNVPRRLIGKSIAIRFICKVSYTDALNYKNAQFFVEDLVLACNKCKHPRWDLFYRVV